MRDEVLFDSIVVKEEYDIEDPKELIKFEIEEVEASGSDGSEHAEEDFQEHPDTESQFSCIACSVDFKDELSYEKHLGVHSREAQESYRTQRLIKEQWNKENKHLNTLSLMPTSESVVCSICFRPVHRRRLFYHKRVHEMKEERSCKTCGKRFRRRTQMEFHCRKVHGEKIECRYCLEMFKTAANIKDHIHKQHRDIHRMLSDPNTCAICKQTYMSSDLRNHIVKHFIEQFYQCTICDKPFLCEKLLKAHIHEVHIPMSNVKPN